MLTFRSIRQKLLFGFGFVLFLVLIIGVLNYSAIQKANNLTEGVIENEVPLLKISERLSFNVAQQIGTLRGYLLYEEPQYKGFFEERIVNGKQVNEEALKLSDTEEMRAIIDKKEAWTAHLENGVALFDAGKKAEALDYINENVESATGEILGDLEELGNKHSKQISSDGADVIKTGDTNILFTIIISLVVIIMGIIVAFLTSKSIVEPIKKLRAHLSRIAQGDLAVEQLTVKTKDEIHDLVEATNEMSTNTRNMILAINEVSDQVTSQSEELNQSASEVRQGSQQVATTMEELATGAETQANRAGDLSVHMSSFMETIENVDAESKEVDRASHDVLVMTKEGSSLMEQSTKQMQRIDRIVMDAVAKVEGLDAQSKEISQLVSVIQAIAEQTNLLALNAAIEAARAGEQGKGFAVVADEVRKLAEQVSVSVHDITEIVGNIQTESNIVSTALKEGYTEVEAGTEQIASTGQTFNSIYEALTSMVSHIESMSKNLANVTKDGNQMNGSIEEIAAISEQSAAGVEETSASTEETTSAMEEVADNSSQLSQLAEQLNDLVGKFKV